MKNSPEHILKDMYTSVRRNKFDRTTSFPVTTSLSMTHVVPFMVKALTGNTTVSLDLTQYLLTESTPTPIFEGMRVDTRLFFCPLRHYVRGIYGDNIDENVDLEQLPLPRAELSGDIDWDYIGSVEGSLVLRGSLLNRLGVPPQIIINGVARPLNSRHLVMGDNEPVTSVKSNRTPSYVNYAVIAAYYDICWRYLSNKFEDKVPIGANNRFNIDESGALLSDLNSHVDTRWYSLSLFGRHINHLRGVMNAGDDSIPSLANLMYGGEDISGRDLFFGTINLLDDYSAPGIALREFDCSVGALVNTFEDKLSNCGLWPTRYDSHYQTMFFKPSDIDGLIEEEFDGGNIKSYRLAQANFSQKLRAILKGRTTRTWMNSTYGTKLKFHDHPIFVGGDSFVVDFQNIVASAPGQQETASGETRAIRLGDSGGRGIGGTKKAFTDDGKKNLKEIRFTTQEPGFLIGLVSCVPAVSYGDVVEDFHEYDTIADFPLPARSGKLFESLRAKNFLFTGTQFDEYEVGKQPYGFRYMTEYGRVNSLYGTRGRESYVFKRDFDVNGLAVSSNGVTNFLNYLKSVYVEPNTFDENFNDAGINGRQNFTLKTMCNMSVILPLEDQVTDYNAF